MARNDSSGASLDALLAEVGGPEVKEWPQTHSLSQRIADLEGELRQQGALLAEVMTAFEALRASLEHAGIQVEEGAELPSRLLTGTDR